MPRLALSGPPDLLESVKALDRLSLGVVVRARKSYEGRLPGDIGLDDLLDEPPSGSDLYQFTGRRGSFGQRFRAALRYHVAPYRPVPRLVIARRAG